MKAVLSNPAHPEYGVATIPFPISKEDYDNCISLLTALEIGNVLYADCKVDEISGEYPVLRRLAGSNVNVDELDYLVKRMESFDARELAQFSALAVTQDIRSVKDYINLTFCCQNIPVVQDFSDLKQIGEFSYMEKNGGTMSQDEMQSIDFEKVALNLLQNENGKITPYGVIYDEGFELEQLYAGQQFPQYQFEDFVMELEVTTTEDMDNDISPVCFYLPMSEMQLERALQRNGFAVSEDIVLRFMDSNLPDDVDVLLDFEEESICDLNALCQAVANFDESDMLKYHAAVLLAEPTAAFELKNLAQQMDCFDFIPSIYTPEDYGKHMIMHSGHFEYDENLADFYNFEKYGLKRMESENGEFNDEGYISYHGTVSIAEILGGVECGRMEMGGMC